MDSKLYDRNFAAGDIVRHFKGSFYRYVDTAIHTETGKEFAVYSALYSPYRTYARPMGMFMSEVDRNKYPNADQPYRFMKVAYPSGGRHWDYKLADGEDNQDEI